SDRSPCTRRTSSCRAPPGPAPSRGTASRGSRRAATTCDDARTARRSSPTPCPSRSRTPPHAPTAATSGPSPAAAETPPPARPPWRRTKSTLARPPGRPPPASRSASFVLVVLAFVEAQIVELALRFLDDAPAVRHLRRIVGHPDFIVEQLAADRAEQLLHLGRVLQEPPFLIERDDPRRQLAQQRRQPLGA